MRHLLDLALVETIRDDRELLQVAIELAQPLSVRFRGRDDQIACLDGAALEAPDLPGEQTVEGGDGSARA